jgi:phage baseplate assembly protein gpV
MAGFDDALFGAMQAATASQTELAATRGKAMSLAFGQVTNTDDPESRRRIKVITDGDTETAWLQSIRTHPGLDSPIPKVGDTVVVAYCDGDSHNGGVYLGTTHNDIVKPLDKRNIDKDYGESVPGDYILDVEGSILIKNKAGASIKLTEDGEIVLTDKRGNKVTLSSWFGDVAFSGNVTIAGKEATVLGATDNKGHTLVSKGY